MVIAHPKKHAGAFTRAADMLISNETYRRLSRVAERAFRFARCSVGPAQAATCCSATPGWPERRSGTPCRKQRFETAAPTK